MSFAGYNQATKKAKQELKSNAPRYPTVTSISPLQVTMPWSNQTLAAIKFKHVSVSIGDIVSVRKYNGSYLIEGVIE